MSQSVNLQEIEKGSRRAINEDGLTFIFLGLLIFFLGATFSSPTMSWMAGLGILLIFPVEMVRRRITYPRIGYVKFETAPGTARGILIFAALSVVALTLLAFAANGRFQTYLPLAFSVVFSLSFYFAAATYGPRLVDWLVFALILGTGFVATWRFDDWHEGAALLFSVTGAVLLLIGILQLIRFLRKYPLPPQSEEA